MAYFDGIKIGDRVWSFEHNYGKVVDVLDNSFIVHFENFEYFRQTYDFNGVKYECLKCNQTLFWDEVKFEVPKRPKIELIERDWYVISPINKNFNNLGLMRNDKETAKKALKTINRFARLLALRDQECLDSRGYEFDHKDGNKYTIKAYLDDEENMILKYEVVSVYLYEPDKVYFKTIEDAQKICDILNSGRFDLEGE